MSKSKLLLMVSGSIAAYKVCSLVSSLKKGNWEVKVVASDSALKFVGEPTWEALSGNPMHSSLWQKGQAMDHIYLERWADLILVAPATAHTINRMAAGVGDDLITNIFLAHQFTKPFLIAPAMNTSMYLNPVTQKSIQTLRDLKVSILESASGVLACGETGYGKLLEPDLIQAEVEKALGKPTAQTSTTIAPTQLPKVLVTAGGTREPIDDVRFLTNASTGSTGENLAAHLSDLGFDVTLLLAESAQVLPRQGYRTLRFDSVSSLSQLLEKELKNTTYDSIVHAAAVSDFTIEKVSGKLSSDNVPELTLKKAPKIIDSLKSWSANHKVKVFGFKLTSQKEKESASREVEKLFQKSNVDYVIQNDSTTLSNRAQHTYNIYQPSGLLTQATGLDALLSELTPLIAKEIL